MVWQVRRQGGLVVARAVRHVPQVVGTVAVVVLSRCVVLQGGLVVAWAVQGGLVVAEALRHVPQVVGTVAVVV